MEKRDRKKTGTKKETKKGNTERTNKEISDKENNTTRKQYVKMKKDGSKDITQEKKKERQNT